MQQLNPVATSVHCTDRYCIHPSLQSSPRIFLRIDLVQPPLRQPYTGPHKVLSRTDKTITIDVNGKKNYSFFRSCQTRTSSLSQKLCVNLYLQ
ncbi:retrovirus-related Pol polyprotein from transposon 412 [Trichonephila clavipes]|uniref:Retrovirus-related Pol polyprotein from transposon 412 n=1 Tax=Trichonephila clavipes TaxID=2585209 RepID=A0A8X6V7W4_TRICX|nr:retrovirus-related Pol polyprotein from transposon 412 [Trichonephila clavipes]